MTSQEKRYIGDACYICLSSKAELVRADESLRIPLSATEYKILSYFLNHAGDPVYLDNLAVYLWGIDADNKQPESLISQISRLRGKLDKMGGGLRNYIDTNYGFKSYTLKIPNGKSEEIGDHNLDRSQSHGNESVRQASYSDLLELGYTKFKIAEELVKNDLQLYQGFGDLDGIAKENEGTAMQWAEYLSSVPDSFQYILNSDNRIVGNFSFLSISGKQEIDFIEGKLSESMFNPAETRDLFCAGDDHILFLLNLSLNDEYSTPRNYSLLCHMFLSQLLQFAEEDILFSKIIVNVFKASHEAFYKQLGFSFVRKHKNSGRIYELILKPYPEKLYEQLRKNRRLREVNERLKEIYGK